jgi:hypothetical protein
MLLENIGMNEQNLHFSKSAIDSANGHKIPSGEIKEAKREQKAEYQMRSAWNKPNAKNIKPRDRVSGRGSCLIRIKLTGYRENIKHDITVLWVMRVFETIQKNAALTKMV